MKKLRLLMMTAACLCVMAGNAAPRSKQQMKQAALQAINAGLQAKHRAPQTESNMLTLKATAQYEIIGTKEQGFAVVAADDLAPAVLGVSNKPYSEGRNTNFEWWLKAVEHAVAHAVSTNTPLTTTKPDPAKYPALVEPMLTTEWDQDAPYNRLLPLSNGGDRVLTGCVATAMAQVLNYHKIPAYGFGTRTVYYPFQDTSGTPITATFGEDFYDWDNMLDKYRGVNYNDVQAQAVALLMRDCGVAANMQYGGEAENGSGAYSDEAADGLRTYFGITDAECLDRSYYSEADWMDMVYRELSENGPLYYSGASYDSGGHAFVLHGYNAEGLVYVNWGWSGEEDGYFDIALLDPSYYHFDMQQDMIIGVKGDPIDLTDEVVTLEKAGTLVDILGNDKIGTVGTLKVTGNINSTDLRQIRRLAGVDEFGARTKGYLKELDLSEARIVSGGSPYLKEQGKQYTTANDELPFKAFYNCRRLSVLKLPNGLKSYGEGALGGCHLLDNITMGSMPANANYVVDDNIIWNKAKTEIIAVLPGKTGTLEIPETVTKLRDYALAGCARLTTVKIPTSVTYIGREAMRGCSALNTIRMAAEEPPTLGGASVFESITVSACYLYVPSGSESNYAKKAQWNVFRDKDFDHIIGYGTAVKVRNTIRYYGEENPQFTYTVTGDAITGTPVLTCEATKDSPAGKYDIKLEMGTIEGENVKLIDGYMIVQKVDAEAKVADATRKEGEENPAFTLTYEGLVNGDETPVWLTAPVLTTTATADSPAGEYPITVEGGVAESYNFTFTAGTLTVTAKETTAISEVRTAEGQNAACYDLSGRRVQQPRQKGLYIVNGKKFVN